MNSFEQFATIINDNFNKLSVKPLYRANTDSEEIKSVYLNAFPEGTNDVYITNTQHDCSCCKHFIRNVGNLVSITNGNITSIWDNCEDAPYPYNLVARLMSGYVKSKSINSIFLASEKKYGAYVSKQVLEDGGVINWNHFHCTIPDHLFAGDSVGEKAGQYAINASMLTEMLNTFSLDAFITVQELIDSNSLYRGEEHKAAVTKAKDLMSAASVYPGTNKLFGLENFRHPAARFKNTVIGTLVEDLSKGKDLEEAVKSFEAKVAPSNYKRPKALITQGMIDKAMDTIRDLGLEDALERRHATIHDLDINDILYSDHAVQGSMKNGIEGLLKSAVHHKVPDLKDIPVITIEDFLSHKMKNPSSVELLVENRHQSNFMNIVAPINESDNLLKWNNNFTWSYNGNVADSMKEIVKASGGKVDGLFRFSIMWNEDNDNPDDLDAHCKGPMGHVYYNNKRCGDTQLDVDITSPGNKAAVENITYLGNKFTPGTYQFYVNNYLARGATSGFKAEFEIDGKTYEYHYPKPLRQDENVQVVTLTVASSGNVTVKHHLAESQVSKEIYGIKTGSFVKVNNIMLSPNHWQDNAVGNKHYMFLLDGANNPEPIRGFYNEFLSNELTESRKVFEILASKMKVQPSDEQLCGLGFSSTVRNDVVVKVDGRPYKVTF